MVLLYQCTNKDENKAKSQMLLLLLNQFSRIRLCATPEMVAHQAPRPWDSPGKNTRVGCHFLLQCMKVKSESEVTQSCLTLSDPMDCSLPGSSAHGICQARVLEWGAIAFSASLAEFMSQKEVWFGMAHVMASNGCFFILLYQLQELRWLIYILSCLLFCLSIG